MMSISLRKFAPADLTALEDWFAERETRRWLGDERWPVELLDLAERMPGRFAFVAIENDVIVGLVDVECEANGQTSIALVVAPSARRRGVGRTIVHALCQRPEMADTVVILAGVEDGNNASRALVLSAGFEQAVNEPDDQGFLYFTLPLRLRG